MGQAFRGATGRIWSMDQSQPTKTKSPFGSPSRNRISPELPSMKTLIMISYFPLKLMKMRFFMGDWIEFFGFKERASRSNSENVLEERDSKYDAMLNQMVGRISAKPGGKLEMGEVS